MKYNVPFRGALTAPIPISGRHMGVLIPSTWETASLTFQVSNDGVTYANLYDSEGAEVTLAAAAGKANTLDSVGEALFPFGLMKVRSGTAASPVVQGVTAASRVFTFGESKTLTITSGLKGQIGEELVFAFETAPDDTLAASVSGTTVTFALAGDTSSKNSASAIQTLLRAQTVSDIDVSSATVAESSGYAAARPTATKAVQVYSFSNDAEEDLGSLTVTAGRGGDAGNFVADISWGVNDSDELSVAYADGSVVILLANATDSNNAAVAIQTALRALEGTDYGEALSLATVAGDATWDTSPSITADVVGRVVAGSTTGADIDVPAAAALQGSASTSIEVVFRNA
jgi:hypothetical protein